MTHYKWILYKDGVTLGGFGIETTLRELSKLAMCVADGGKCIGQQVISTNWIEEMTLPQIQLKDFNIHLYAW